MADLYKYFKQPPLPKRGETGLGDTVMEEAKSVACQVLEETKTNTTMMTALDISTTTLTLHPNNELRLLNMQCNVATQQVPGTSGKNFSHLAKVQLGVFKKQ